MSPLAIAAGLAVLAAALYGAVVVIAARDRRRGVGADEEPQRDPWPDALLGHRERVA